jgi:hypothetical protein
MIHRLAITTLDPWPSIAITAEDFRDIRKAKTNLMTALGIEEKFALLVENYTDYERTLLDLSLKNMVQQGWLWDSFMDDMQMVNRRIANLLMAAALYADEISHDISGIFGRKSQAATDLRGTFETEAKQSLEYRVMKELRNHVQHRDLAVGKLSYPGSHQADGKSGVRFGIQVDLDADGLCSSPRIDPVAITDLQSPAARDMTAVLRKSLESLSRIHEVVRQLTESEVDTHLAKMEDVLKVAQAEIGHLIGLAAIEQSDDGIRRETIPVFRELSERVRQMRTRYRNLKFCSGWYVSSGLA